MTAPRILSVQPLGWLRGAMAVAMGLIAVAVSHAGIESPRLLAAIGRETPAAVRMPATAVWSRAQAAAAEISGGRALAGVGVSMAPLYTGTTAVVVAPQDFSTLRKGMTVVYRGSSGRLVAHALTARMPQGWVAQGVGNAFEDDDLVTPANLVGVVVAAYSSEGSEQPINL